MDFAPETLAAICRRVTREGAEALRAHRLGQRQARLIEPEVLTPDQAEFHDLNRIVWSAVADAMPLCQATGVRLVVELERRLPSIPLLVRPIEDMVSAAMDLCLDGQSKVLRVATRLRSTSALTIIERSCRVEAESQAPAEPAAEALQGEWFDVGSMGQVELMVGELASRALGGRLKIRRRADDLRFLLELPSSGEHLFGLVSGGPPQRRPALRLKRALRLPGIASNNQQL